MAETKPESVHRYRIELPYDHGYNDLPKSQNNQY